MRPKEFCLLSRADWVVCENTNLPRFAHLHSCHHLLFLIPPVHAKTQHCQSVFSSSRSTETNTHKKRISQAVSTCENFKTPLFSQLASSVRMSVIFQPDWVALEPYSVFQSAQHKGLGCFGSLWHGGTEQEGGWRRRRRRRRPARSGFSWLPAFFTLLHLLKAAPSALTNAGDRMAEQQTKAFTPLLTTHIHLSLGASCAAWAMSPTCYYTSTGLGGFTVKVERDVRVICLSSVYQSGAVYRWSPSCPLMVLILL